MKCLIVDDVALNLIVCEKMLSSFHFEISKASNGKMVIDMINQGQKPDLILLDLMMPIKDGFDTLKEIREGKVNINPNVPIIVLSALNREEDVARAMSLGATGFVSKPIIMARLLSTVKKCINSAY